MKKVILNSLMHARKSMLTLLTLVAVLAMASCSKDPTEFKLVPSDGTQVWYFNGYSIGSNGPDYIPANVQDGKFQPVQGVVLKFEDGKTLSSDADGKITFKLPEGDYLYRMEIPTPWGTYWDATWEWDSNWQNGRYNYTVIFMDDYNDRWDRLSVYGAYTEIRRVALYRR